MSGVKVKVMTFQAPADITAPGALDGVVARAQLFADTLYLEREELPGNISALSQQILRLAPIAPADTRAAAQLVACIGHINRLLAIWPTLKAAQASQHNGAIGGRRPKRKLWGAATAEKLASEYHSTEEAAWLALPSHDAAWDIETDEADYEVYADGDSVIAVDCGTRKEQRALKKSTFLKNYYRPARLAGK